MLYKNKQTGFTIVELLIVIVVIAILAAITVVAFNGVQKKARESGVTAALSQAATQLELDKVVDGRYPGSLALGNQGSGIGKPGDIATLQYATSVNGDIYCLSGTNSDIAFHVSDTNKTPANGVCTGHTPADNGGTPQTAPAVTLVKSRNNFGASSQPNTYTGDFAQPTAGNLLVLLVQRNASSTSNVVFNTGNYVKGWASAGKVNSGGLQVELFWKIASSSESGGGVWYTYSDYAVTPRAHVLAEFSVASPYSFSHSATATSHSGSTSVPSLASASANATSPFNLVIAASTQANSSSGTMSWTNGVANPVYVIPYSQTGGMGWKVDNTTGAKSSTVTWTNSNPTITILSLFSLTQ